MTNSPAPIGVVIPFYQRQKGILARAVNTIAKQTIRDDILVVIVDDESPASAEPELIGEQFRPGVQILLRRQKNGGPGGARNNALSVIPTNIQIVAFLDSDDEWHEDHIANALHCFQKGSDLYFSNVQYFDEDESTRLLRSELIRERRSVDGTFTSDAFVHLVLSGAVQTSSVVYRIDGRRHIRFPEDFRFGEDQYFWISLALASSRITGSSEIECNCGKGVNIFRSNRWGSPDIAARAADQLRFHKKLRKLTGLPSEAKTLIDMKLPTERLQLAQAVLHDAARGRLAPMISSIRDHPEICASLVPAAWGALRRASH